MRERMSQRVAAASVHMAGLEIVISTTTDSVLRVKALRKLDRTRMDGYDKAENRSQAPKSFAKT